MLELVALTCAGALAGVVNVVAGGGSLLSIPLLIFFGLPPTVANGTNRVAILVQNIGATASFQRRRLVPWAWVRLGAPAATVGAALGTWAAISVGDLAFRRMLAVVMVGAALLMIRRPMGPEMIRRSTAPGNGHEPGYGEPVAGAPAPGRSPILPTAAEQSAAGPFGLGQRKASSAFPGRRGRVGAALGFLLLGFYGGLIQAGIGFLALALFSALGLGLIRANALKVTTILVFTPLTLIVFAMDGSVDWRFGIALALGNFVGGLLGVRLQVLKGSRWVRGFVTVTVIAFALRLVLDDLLGLAG